MGRRVPLGWKRPRGRPRTTLSDQLKKDSANIHQYRHSEPGLKTDRCGGGTRQPCRATRPSCSSSKSFKIALTIWWWHRFVPGSNFSDPTRQGLNPTRPDFKSLYLTRSYPTHAVSDPTRPVIRPPPNQWFSRIQFSWLDPTHTALDSTQHTPPSIGCWHNTAII